MSSNPTPQPHRTSPHPIHLQTQDHNSLGFLSNERRFNVALTRATSLCIIVGNPFLMLARPHWKVTLTPTPYTLHPTPDTLNSNP